MTPHALLETGRLAGDTVLRTQPDERLVELVRSGSLRAFDAIVGRYRGDLLRYCGRYLAPDGAEDAVQQAFVSAYSAMIRDEADLHLRPWLYRIVRNAALDTIRAKPFQHEQLDENIDGVERPEQALERRESVRRVVDAVRVLPDHQRQAIVLRELEGRSYDEIGVRLGVSDHAVRQLLHRARTRLRVTAKAIVPVGWFGRLPWRGGSPQSVQVADLCSSSGTAQAISQICATAVVAGTIAVGGAAITGGITGHDSHQVSPVPHGADAARASGSKALGRAARRPHATEGRPEAYRPSPRQTTGRPVTVRPSPIKARQDNPTHAVVTAPAATQIVAPAPGPSLTQDACSEGQVAPDGSCGPSGTGPDQAAPQQQAAPAPGQEGVPGDPAAQPSQGSGAADAPAGSAPGAPVPLSQSGSEGQLPSSSPTS